MVKRLRPQPCRTHCCVAPPVRRAAAGLVRGNAPTFNQLLQRYAKEYGFKVR